MTSKEKLKQETDYAWAAGIVDGEGYLGMIISKVGVNRRKTESYQIQLRVVMTHYDTIKRFCDIFEIGEPKFKKAKNPLKHKPTYGCTVTDKKAIVVIEKILPYLTTKKLQAELFLDFRKNCGKGNLIDGVCNPDMVKERNDYFLKLKELNKRGV